MGSKQEMPKRTRRVVISLSDEELAILERLHKDRNLSFSDLVSEALEEMDGEPYVC